MLSHLLKGGMLLPFQQQYFNFPKGELIFATLSLGSLDA